MSEESDKALGEAEEAIEAGKKLVNAQEAEVAELRKAGGNASRAEALLEAYRYAVHVAVQKKDALLGNRFSVRKDEHDL